MLVENMSSIGSLPNIEVPKLKSGTVSGGVWELVGGKFLPLKYLEMQDLSLHEWRDESEHFPQLETLEIKYCSCLMEVPTRMEK